MGAPLTDDELRSIVGGTRTTNCVCSYTYAGSGSGSETVGAADESICSAKCDNTCKSNPQCISFTYSYTAVGD